MKPEVAVTLFYLAIIVLSSLAASCDTKPEPPAPVVPVEYLIWHANV